jgi:hypothetical protein
MPVSRQNADATTPILLGFNTARLLGASWKMAANVTEPCGGLMLRSEFLTFSCPPETSFMAPSSAP